MEEKGAMILLRIQILMSMNVEKNQDGPKSMSIACVSLKL